MTASRSTLSTKQVHNPEALPQASISRWGNHPLPAQGTIQRAQLAPQSLSSQEVMTLQRSMGNRAVSHLLRKPSDGESAHPLQEVGTQGGEIDAATARSIHAAKGGGQRMEQRLQRRMEGGIGASFSQVKLHRDRRADQLNRSLNARAFTTGKNVFFRQGEYQPHSRDGQELIAHELTHVVQQSGDSPSGVQRVQRWPWSRKNKKSKKTSTAPETEMVQDFTETSESESVSPWLQPRQHRLTIDESGLEDMRRGYDIAPETQLVDESAPPTMDETQGETVPPRRKPNKTSYPKLMNWFIKGRKKLINPEKLERAHLSAGSLGIATPDYVNPELEDEPDRFTVTVAVAQEHDDWWDTVKKMKSTGIRKIFQSPLKFLRRIKEDEGEDYLLEKVLKQQDKLPEDQKERAKAIKKASDRFSDVGHTWVRFTKRVGGHIKELYSYGFWPRKIFGDGGYDMAKYVPGQVRHPDTKHEKDEEKRYFDVDVTPDQFNAALERAQSHYESPPTYHLLDYNCTKFAREILKAAGGSFPGKGIFPSFAFNPGQLFKKLGDLQRDQSDLAHNEFVRDEDSDEDQKIIDQVREDQETRSRTASNEEFGLTPQDPADYPEGMHLNPLRALQKIKGADSIGERATKQIEIHPIETKNWVVVEDDNTRKYGRGILNYKAENKMGEWVTKKIFVDLDPLIPPGKRPTHTRKGKPIKYPKEIKPEVEDPGKLPEIFTTYSALQDMRMENWDDLPSLGIEPSMLDELNEAQVAKLAELIYLSPKYLARVIARLNGKTVPPPKTVKPPPTQHRLTAAPRTTMSAVPLRSGPTTTSSPLSSTDEPQHLGTVRAVWGGESQLLGTARAVWGRAPETSQTQDDEPSTDWDSDESSFDDFDEDSDEYIELPEQIDDAIISMINYDEWDMIFMSGAISPRIFKELDEDQVEFLAELTRKDPETLQATIDTL